MSLRPNDVPEWKVDAAKEFVREPLSDGFNAWKTLKDRDLVTMTIAELGKLMAWYAEIQVERATRAHVDLALHNRLERGAEELKRLEAVNG